MPIAAVGLLVARASGWRARPCSGRYVFAAVFRFQRCRQSWMLGMIRDLVVLAGGFMAMMADFSIAMGALIAG